MNPTWRHSLRVSWETPGMVDLSTLWRFIGPSSFDNNSANPALAGAEEGAYDPAHACIPGYNYVDVTASVHPWQGVEVRAGVKNLFDKDPPLLPAEITAQMQSNSFLAYDLVGRQLFVAVTAKS